MTRLSLVALLLLAACEREPVRIDNVSQHACCVEFVNIRPGAPPVIKYVKFHRPSDYELTCHADTP